MRGVRRRIAALFVALGFAAGCIPNVPTAADRPAVAAAPAAAKPASPAFSDARAAFVDGYRAYQAQDFAHAARSLSYAADRFTELRDYALFFLASAERELGHDESAAAIFARVVSSYPQSVKAPEAQLELAKLELKLGRAADARKTASSLIRTTSNAAIEQEARLVAATALLAANDPRAAYRQATALREKFPRGPHDTDARELAYRILREHPGVAATGTFDYHVAEAELLLKEGQGGLALAEAKAASRLSPPPAKAAEVVWLKARALRGEPDKARRELLEYLRIAPQGGSVTLVLEALAINYWNAGDRAAARKIFGRLARDFSESKLAPNALLRIGRIYEEEARPDAARAQYLKLIARYPFSDAALDARFRAPWMLYATGKNAAAAHEFERMSARVKNPSERDMFIYWRARALEKSGDTGAAASLYRALAAGAETNYYPALAARRVGAVPVDFPAARATLAPQTAAPRVDGAGEFHLSRALTLRSLGLQELEAGEFKALAAYLRGDRGLRDFVLSGLASSGAYYDLIVEATRLSARGELPRDLAEKLRYPRGYWDLLFDASRRTSLDPYVVVALTRQESLFDPRATSRSDARGLMQLLPTTARRVAKQIGVNPESLDLYDPALNVKLGTAYLRSLFAMFGGDEFRAVAAYNAGERAVERWNARHSGEVDEWVENIGYRETRDYVKKVIGGRREYLLLYQSDSKSAPSPIASPSPGST